GENLSIPLFLMERYLRCGKLLLDDMFTLNPKHGESYQWALYREVRKVQKGPYPKGQTQRQALTGFLKEMASRAFRRPVTANHGEKYAGVFDQAQEQGLDFDASIRLPLMAVLASPRFVLLWGDSRASGQRSEAAPVRTLGDWELATRLSLFLWSSLPDQQLYQAAQQGRLQDPQVIEQQVRRMLGDRRVIDGLVKGFLCQW